MNRRQFSSMFLATASMLGLPPALARATSSPSACAAESGWGSSEQCQKLLGRQFRASGPTSANFELVEVIPHSSEAPVQYFTRFRSDQPAPEGIYLLEDGRRSKALFLQPVPGQPDMMEAAFSLHSV